MRETLKGSPEELTALANGKSNEIEIRSYNLTEAPSFTGQDIKDIRSKVGVSRAVFADILGVSTRAIEKRKLMAQNLMEVLEG
ncbi:hypothetical protein GCM10025886_18350 [Tetragenococcus halophilus subsp. flandriensis]|uniref:helix-turn-helix domain-containing protein n=1 Tax=Tetragenococcus halophilus TaxID=51669 RepID=UPI0023E9D1D6|nr:hypothetical protein [Tetragenococcus halophilus]GMA08684.1 hypothetical protein GCM10025886_18350 [Tetragenococcus halophilus subsp. flandriensis]